MAKMLMCSIIVTLVCIGFVAPVLGITSFINGNPVDPRRQLSFNQQGQILSDVQQNQRFAAITSSPGEIRQPHLQNGFVQPSPLPINQAVPFSQNSQQFIVQQSIPFGSGPQNPQIIAQPQVQFDRPLAENNPQFLQSQQNIQFPQNVQQSKDVFFQQAPQRSNGHQLQIPIQVQSIRPSQQIPPQPPTLHSFLPTLPTQESQQQNVFDFQNFKSNSPIGPTSIPENFQANNQLLNQNNAQIGFQSNIGTNPLFSSDQSTQLKSLLEEQRKQDLERLRELQERQKIIQKHKQFLERQQQKQQQKVQKLHEDFTVKQKKKQEEIFATSRPISEYTLNTQSGPREILPHEVQLFEKAIKSHEDRHPTTTPLPPATTTRRPTTKSRQRQRPKQRVENDNQELFIQGARQKIYKQLKSALHESDEEKNDGKETSNKLQYIGRQDLLKQLKLALAENTENIQNKNFTSREITLPNGEKFEIVRGTDPSLLEGASSALPQLASQNQLVRSTKKPSKISFEDITKDVLPPGADFEIIKQDGNGKLEVGKLPPTISNQKKVTFVFIEEQDDGSYQVKGVRGNDDSKNIPSKDVDHVLQKIKEGEYKSPSNPETKRPKPSPVTKTSQASTVTRGSTRGVMTFAKSTSTRRPQSTYEQHYESKKLDSTTPNYYSSATPSSLSINHNGSPTPSASINYDSSSDFDSTTPGSSIYYKSTQSDLNDRTPSSAFYNQSPTTTVNGHQMYSISTRQYNQESEPAFNNAQESIQYSQTPSFVPPTSSSYTNEDLPIFPSSSTYYPSTNVVSRSTTPKSIPETAGSQLAYSSVNPGIIDILKENGLFATAKYLKQSGLDTILNETGPYTVFAPTDKAFRTLLIQLGGPDKAEEKFKENPRLLSGLLLHHIIPGSFEISSLQDEMTGVSLAGTQLRVNQYDMHDVEWNEIKVTTVNGARVISDKQDIAIPQGIAHAVDRVMFPLPVGDIVQTLQADRERRFTNFLKALFSSGLVETLSDSKTYTVFAPIDRSFSSMSSEELQQLVTDKERSKELVMRHIAPGTLFSAGMRYYQVRDSMAQEKPITLQKNAGRVKVNAGHVITHNIPATNGVIHAVDTLL